MASEAKTPRMDSKIDLLAIIPARGGSKGVPRKNVRLVAGKPLIAYSIEQALQSKYVTKVVVSTDDAEIKEVAQKYGAEIVDRPAELAQDNTPMLPVLKHAVETMQKNGFLPKIVILLQPTNPLRKVSQIDEAIQMLIEKKCDSVTTVNKLDVNPSCVIKRNLDGKAIPILTQFYGRRQDIDPLYAINGLIYVYKAPALLRLEQGSWCENNGALVVDTKYSLDIDTEDDLEKANQILSKNGE